jgi:phosphopantetheinyl transferase
MCVQRQREWLSIRVLLKEMLGKETRIFYTDSGQPYLPDSLYRIGISHTKGFVALALDEKGPVGVDIECISERVERIRDRFMSVSETKKISQKQPLIHLLLHWSAKEALLKCMDEKAIDFRSQLHIHPFEPVVGEWSELRAHETCTEQSLRFTIRYRVEENYVLTVCQDPRSR